MKKKFTLPALAACALLAAYSLPAAADGGPYVAADLGRSHFSGGIFDQFSGPGTTVSDTDSAYRFTFGYQFTPYWGFEAGYVGLGQGNSSYREPPSMGFTATGTRSAKVYGFYAAGTGTLPISDRWSLYARAGTFASTVESDFQCNNGDCSLGGGPQQQSGAGATYGVGAKWNFSPDWSLRLGWDHYSNLGDDSFTANLLSLGIEWHFFQ